jgi:argininosuccinate synthase
MVAFQLQYINQFNFGNKSLRNEHIKYVVEINIPYEKQRKKKLIMPLNILARSLLGKVRNFLTLYSPESSQLTKIPKL